MASADLYLDSVDLAGHINRTDCGDCGHKSCSGFTESLRTGSAKPVDCPFLGRNEAFAIETALRIPSMLPEVPALLHPRPAFAGAIELNSPNPSSIIIVSGNNEYTEQILMTVLGTTSAPLFMLFVDTGGNTVDMSIVFKTLTPEGIRNALDETGLMNRSVRKEMVIPGLAYSIKEDIEKLTGWHVTVGPVCAAGLPIFLSEIWGGE